MQAIDQLRGVAEQFVAASKEGTAADAMSGVLTPCINAHSECVSRAAFDVDKPVAVTNALFKQAIKLHERVDAHAIPTADLRNQHALWLHGHVRDALAAEKAVLRSKRALREVRAQVEAGKMEGPDADSWDLLVRCAVPVNAVLQLFVWASMCDTWYMCCAVVPLHTAVLLQEPA